MQCCTDAGAALMLGGKAHPHEARRVEPGTAWPRACMAMAIPDQVYLSDCNILAVAMEGGGPL